MNIGGVVYLVTKVVNYPEILVIDTIMTQVSKGDANEK